MSEETHNFTHSGLDKTIRLGKDGILIRNIDSNKGADFKSPNNGKYINVRGANAVRSQDFITKEQLDNIFFLNDKVLVLANGVTNVKIGLYETEKSFTFDYTLSYGDNEYQTGTFRILVNKMATRVTMSHENLFITDEIDEITFDAKIIGDHVVLEITNTSIDKQYDFLYSTGSLSSFKLTTSMLEQQNLGSVLISQLPELDNGIDSVEDVFVIEDASDNYEKKQINLNYFIDKLAGSLNIEGLPGKVAVKNTDILVIEDSEDAFRKKKVLLNEFLGEFHLNAMSFNA